MQFAFVVFMRNDSRDSLSCASVVSSYWAGYCFTTRLNEEALPSHNICVPFRAALLRALTNMARCDAVHSGSSPNTNRYVGAGLADTVGATHACTEARSTDNIPLTNEASLFKFDAANVVRSGARLRDGDSSASEAQPPSEVEGVNGEPIHEVQVQRVRHTAARFHSTAALHRMRANNIVRLK